MPRHLASSAGFTYIAALVMVVIVGIMHGVVGQSMRTVMKREREKELLFRGLQIRDAIERWNKKGTTPLLDLKNLLQDPRSVSGERLLRKLYEDPVSGKEWQILKDPNLGIYGVASVSEEEPLKKAEFPEVIKDFKDKQKYSEWQFIYKRPVSAPGGSPAATQQPQLSLPFSTPEGP